LSDFSALLERAKGGDAEALDKLYEQFAGPVVGAIRRRLTQPLRRRFDTLDIAQSVFADVLRDLPRFRDLGESAFRHWLYLRVETKVVSKLRKHLGKGARRWEQRLESGTRVPSPGPSPPSNVARIERDDQARDLVSALNDEQRTLVLLRLEEDLSFAQIAERMGLKSAEAARKRYARCLAKLRAIAFATDPGPRPAE
jgi:RNA polymerase sigma-70 factor (ECF subfamily)